MLCMKISISKPNATHAKFLNAANTLTMVFKHSLRWRELEKLHHMVFFDIRQWKFEKIAVFDTCMQCMCTCKFQSPNQMWLMQSSWMLQTPSQWCLNTHCIEESSKNCTTWCFLTFDSENSKKSQFSTRACSACAHANFNLRTKCDACKVLECYKHPHNGV